ncbi:MAG TPA: prepilin-type N-terminal cleavage/methylation domain-containing protein [Stellaceae bacterium]|jgi:general secretion pathway protein I|nr:prepilin-type N-terminal cleavage/methylation domain-containing protein [Stellaceae bacterium]
MARRADESGFTLIEVLVATTIAALLLLPLLRGFSTGLATTTRSGGLTEATLIAQSTLETIGAQRPLDAATSVDRQDGRYHVTAAVHPYSSADLANDASLPVAPYEITVTVDWPEGAKLERVAVRTLRLAPAQNAAASP